MSAGAARSSSTGLAGELATALSAHRAGDRDAAGVLVRRATPLLWQAARSFGLDAALAEDAVQNTLLALFRHGDSINEPQAVLRWLVVTVQREAQRLRRPEQRVTFQADAGMTEVAPRDAEPEQRVLDDERREVMWQAVGRLSERCRRLLRVVACGERPDYATLASALGMPVGSIGPTRGRCLAKLRELLAADPRWAAS